MAFLLNPKNLLLIALLLLAVAGGSLFLWEKAEVEKGKVTIATQAGQITDLQKTNADIQGQVADYKANLVAIRKAQAEQQAIANITASLQAKTQTITSKCEVNEDDQKVIDSITSDFNNAGMLAPADSGSKAGAESVSKTDTPGSGNSQRYTLKIIIENYLNLINYTLQLERTNACYETPAGIP